MKERTARKVIVFLLGFAIFIFWWSALCLLTSPGTQQGPPALLESSFKRNITSIAEPKNTTKSGVQKPYFVLHVGPPKTATTSLQCGLEFLSDTLAQQDSYIFVGKRCPRKKATMANGEEGIPGHHLMMGLIDANPHSRGYEKLQERMDFHHSRGNNMIFSIEAMSNHLENRPETWKLFLSLFRNWNVRVVVAYRHYFDWIRSMYFQQHIGKKYREQWPHEKGLEHPSFHDYLKYHLERWEQGTPSNDGHSWGQHLTLYAYEYFSEHFQDVRIFNLHQEGDVLTNFVCQMLPGARETCERLKVNPLVEIGVTRESHSFDAERLALAAYNEGILSKEIPRARAVKMVSSQLQTTNSTIELEYLACLTADLQTRFLNASLWFENRIISSVQGDGKSDRKIPEDAQDHRKLFEEAVVSMKFCEIDTGHVLKIEKWRKFISGMKPDKKKKKKL